MSDPAPPPVGNMYLYDDMTPPLLDGAYRFRTRTDVTLDIRNGGTGTAASEPLAEAANFFNVEGPRFTLAATEVAGVFPPRNGHGAFADTIAHIALGRRTLPWERNPKLPAPKHPPGDPPPPNAHIVLDPQGAQIQVATPPPWLALLVFEENEYTLHQNVPLESVVPPGVFAALGRPQGVTCDSVEADLALVRSLMPSVDELTVLTHVRQVNVDDRELSAGDSDGWFSIVMSNRIPGEGAKCRACLVSVECRTDLVPTDPPPIFTLGNVAVEVLQPVAAVEAQPAAERLIAGGLPQRAPVSRFPVGGILIRPTAQLVLLHSWLFETTFTGTFRELMQGLNVGMFGNVADPGHPAITDSGHLQLEVDDRAGVEESVWYRGPLVQYQLTRDPLGPYHSADQCRRATPETGGEDISYAAAFEVGRLLAASDARLAQELMRWRREGYRQSARADTKIAVEKAIALVQPLDLHTPWSPVMSASAATSVFKGAGPIADPFGLNVVSRAEGLNPATLAAAWQLTSVAEATAILGGDPGVLGAAVEAPPLTDHPDVTLDSVVADTASLDRLRAVRQVALANVSVTLGGQQP